MATSRRSSGRAPRGARGTSGRARMRMLASSHVVTYVVACTVATNHNVNKLKSMDHKSSPARKLDSLPGSCCGQCQIGRRNSSPHISTRGRRNTECNPS